MKRAILFLSIFICSHFAQASSQNIGYLKIHVENVNPDHKSTVSIYLNNNKFTEFSHSLKDSFIKSVGLKDLAKGERTPIKASYENLQTGCSFEFSILFSHDNFSWISIGKFLAPSDHIKKYIPLGLCADKPCSSDPAIQKRLNEIGDQMWERNAKALKKWLDDAVDSEKKRLAEETEKLKASSLSTAEDQDWNSELESINDELDASTLEQSDLNETGFQEREFSQDIDSAIESADVVRLVDNDDLKEKLGALEFEQSFYDSCGSSDMAKYLCVKYGGMAPLVWMSIGIGLAISDNPEQLLEYLNERVSKSTQEKQFESIVEKIADRRLEIQSAIESQGAYSMVEEITKVARLGVAFSPLNDFVDLCEAVSGREFCGVSGGRLLSRDERFFALMGVMAGNRFIWSSWSKKAKLEIFRNVDKVEDFLKSADEIAESGIAIKELRRSAKKIGFTHADDIKKNVGIIESWKDSFKATKIDDASFVNKNYIEPPYLAGTKVVKFETSTEEVFHRVHGIDNKERSWILRQANIEGLSPQQIKDKFNLPEIPTKISEVHVPTGTKIQTGVVGPNAFGNGRGAVQYELLDRLDKRQFINTKDL